MAIAFKASRSRFSSAVAQIWKSGRGRADGEADHSRRLEVIAVTVQRDLERKAGGVKGHRRRCAQALWRPVQG